MGKKVSKYSIYEKIIKQIHFDNHGVMGDTQIALLLIERYQLGNSASLDSLRKYIGKVIDRTEIPKELKESCVDFNGGKENILIIGDLHEPFCRVGYLQFCKDVYNRFNCNKVIFIGDIIDNHHSSYHETNPNALGGMDELELSIHKIKMWYNAFPVADVIIGNHDRMIMRKAQTSSIPSAWIKQYKDVLNTPNWNFVESIVYNKVLYIHGEGGTARSKMKSELHSCVQGHLHTQAYCEHLVGSNFRIFGMQVGCGIDHSSYAMAYAKASKKPAIGCGVVLANGEMPINILMNL
jgi:metallophosphoesterase superfamily enzyme